MKRACKPRRLNIALPLVTSALCTCMPLAAAASVTREEQPESVEPGSFAFFVITWREINTTSAGHAELAGRS